MTHNWDPDVTKLDAEMVEKPAPAYQLPLPGLEVYVVKDAYFEFNLEMVSPMAAQELMDFITDWCETHDIAIGGGFRMVAETEEFGDA